MTAKKEKKPFISAKVKLWLIALLVPVIVMLYSTAFFLWDELKKIPLVEELVQEITHERQVVQLQQEFDIPIPTEYIPIYMAAAERYSIPWTLLAAHHRIETRFSTMKKLESPVGAEGHMQVRL